MTTWYLDDTRGDEYNIPLDSINSVDHTAEKVLFFVS